MTPLHTSLSSTLCWSDCEHFETQIVSGMCLYNTLHSWALTSLWELKPSWVPTAIYYYPHHFAHVYYFPSSFCALTPLHVPRRQSQYKANLFSPYSSLFTINMVLLVDLQLYQFFPSGSSPYLPAPRIHFRTSFKTELSFLPQSSSSSHMEISKSFTRAQYHHSCFGRQGQ